MGELNVITRLGLKPETTKDDVINALSKFGEDDSFYSLMNVYLLICFSFLLQIDFIAGRYPINALEGWTIRQGVIHAPGPYPTFEIQFAQDDFHLASMRYCCQFRHHYSLFSL